MLPRREREVGAIGDHTMSHPDLRTLGLAAAKAEIEGGRAAALRAAGGPVDLFRPPYGPHTAAIDREVAREGMAQIPWNVDSTDSRTSPAARLSELDAQCASTHGRVRSCSCTRTATRSSPCARSCRR